MIFQIVILLAVYVAFMYCVINDTVKRCNPDSQGLAKATLWVVVVFAGVMLFSSLLRDA
jgi:hypothetical protein